MDNKIRLLERQGNSIKLRRAYQRAGQTDKLLKAVYNAGTVEEHYQLGLRWTPMERALLWARNLKKKQLQIREYDPETGQWPRRVTNPEERSHQFFRENLPQTGPTAEDFENMVEIEFELDGLCFKYFYYPRGGPYGADFRIQCPSCDRWIAFPAQFRSHARTHDS